MRKLGAFLSLAILCGFLAGAVEAGGRFNPATVQTISGQVTGVETIPTKKGGPPRVLLHLATSGGVFKVRLGPAQFIQQQNFVFAPGDQVTVIGSMAGAGKRGATIVAAEVQKDGQVLKLRDPAGNPLWGGKRRY
jgi:hypothetical protein